MMRGPAGAPSDALPSCGNCTARFPSAPQRRRVSSSTSGCAQAGRVGSWTWSAAPGAPGNEPSTALHSISSMTTAWDGCRRVQARGAAHSGQICSHCWDGLAGAAPASSRGPDGVTGRAGPEPAVALQHSHSLAGQAATAHRPCVVTTLRDTQGAGQHHLGSTSPATPYLSSSSLEQPASGGQLLPPQPQDADAQPRPPAMWASGELPSATAAQSSAAAAAGVLGRRRPHYVLCMSVSTQVQSSSSSRGEQLHDGQQGPGSPAAQHPVQATTRSQRQSHSTRNGSSRVQHQQASDVDQGPDPGQGPGTQSSAAQPPAATSQAQPAAGGTQFSPEPLFVMDGDEAEAPGIPVLGPRTPRRRQLQRPQRPSPPPAAAAAPSTEWEPSQLQPPLPAGAEGSPDPSQPQLRGRLFGSPREAGQDAPAGTAWGSGSPGPGLGEAQQQQEQQQQYEERQYWQRQQQAYRSVRQLRIARALPLQLVPLSPQHPLLDPATQAPLAGSADSSNGSMPQGQEQRRQGVALPLLGPWLLANDARSFPSCDAVVEFDGSPNPDVPNRFGLRLEYVAQRDQDVDMSPLVPKDPEQAGAGSLEPPAGAAPHGSLSGMGSLQLAGSARAGPPMATLHLFNISRRRRGYTAAATVFVTRQNAPELAGQEQQQQEEEEEQAGVEDGSDSSSSSSSGTVVVEPGSRGVELYPGDVITLGTTPDAPRFLVAVMGGGPRSSTVILDTTLQRYCSSSHSANGGPTGSRQRGATPGTRRPSPAVAALAAAAESGAVLELPQISQLARAIPTAAHVAYQTLVQGPHRHDAFAWIGWAQLCARQGLLRQARDLFRSAVAAAAPADSTGDPVDAAAAAAASWPGMHSRGTAAWLGPAALNGDSHEHGSAGNASGWQSGWHESGWQQPLNGADTAAEQAVLGPVFQPGDSTVGLVQALYQWGRFEWGVGRLKGAARHLWRAAADAAMLHPAGPEAGGLGVVMHTWAVNELESQNVVNARVVVAEALRKCPTDQPLFVVAASVELEGGNLELAREFCLRAYELDRADKHLYSVWPVVMAGLGERDKARVLFERGLDYHPRNTKILNAYALFESQQGDLDAAAELHSRALAIDSSSWTTMYNRAAWAKLEMSVGHMDTARKLLVEGLQLHPTHLGALLALARLNRLLGNWAEAQRVLRSAAQCTHQFDLDLLREKAALFYAMGEVQLARAVEAHIDAVRQWQAAKRAGMNTGDAWQIYQGIIRNPVRRALARKAFERKVELGFLQAPGVPGPKAARQAQAGRGRGQQPAVPWVPLPATAPPAYGYGSQPAASGTGAEGHLDVDGQGQDAAGAADLNGADVNGAHHAVEESTLLPDGAQPPSF